MPVQVASVTAPARRPCEPWSSVTTCDKFLTELCGIEASFIDRSLLISTEILWALSGRKYGVCSMTVRPCQRSCGTDAMPWYGAWPYIGAWPESFAIESLCRSCRHTCSCTNLHEIRLPRRPVSEVTEVKVDGVVLDESAYRVDDWQWLVRLDGQEFPTCQDLTLSDAEEGTWSIAFSYGRTVPETLKWASERYACEWVKAMVGRDDCELPENVQSVARQGITIAFDMDEVLTKGKTGLRDVDQILAVYNPNGLQRSARLYRADARPGFRRVGT